MTGMCKGLNRSAPRPRSLSEPSSGSDAFALKTRAVDNGDGTFTLNGTKCWISNAKEARYVF